MFQPTGNKLTADQVLPNIIDLNFILVPYKVLGSQIEDQQTR